LSTPSPEERSCRRSSVVGGRRSSACGSWPSGVLGVPSRTGWGAQLGHFRSGWVALPDHPCTTRHVCQAPPQGSLRGPGRQALFPKCLFYVHGSVPFGVSGRFAYTEAPVLRAAGPSIFQRRKSDEHFTCTGSYFFLAARLAFGWGCPAGLGKGRLQGHPSRGQSAGSSVSRKREHTFCRKRAFRVHGNTGSAGQPEPRARPACKISCTSTTGWVSCGGWVDQPCFPSGCFT
jgi:hypothetical protein